MMSDGHRVICPACESGELRPCGPTLARCVKCDSALGGDLLKTLRQISVLPEALGGHACDCGHPEMRHLPDGVFWCPACGSEVTPLERR